MRFEIPQYHHASGRHCGSGSLVNLCRYEGIALSEPMVIGLGSSLGFAFYAVPSMSPSHGFLPRASSLESDFCERVGIGITRHRESDPARAWQETRGDLLAGKPVLLNSDIYELRYFGSKTHFNGHKTLLVGFDEEAGTALISDTEFPEIQAEPLETLAKARASRFPPFVEGGSPWFTFQFPKELRPLAAAVREAVHLQAQRMLDARHPFGAKAIAPAAKDLLRWGEAADWKWCARFGYQIIERRGTGGGAFRKMYAEFLAEAASLVPEIEENSLPGRMAQIASDWTALAVELKKQSELESSPDFRAASRLLERIAERELAFYEKALAGVRP